MTRVLVVHGGAGTTATSPDQQRGCERAAALGWDVLTSGGSALDAVISAVRHLEDDPSFNAGYGACLTEAGTVELDASAMEGTQRRAGAVAVVRRVRNPVLVARALMEDPRHLFLVGEGAEQFAAAAGLPLVDPDALVTPERRRAWEARMASRAGENTDASDGADPPGTVGAVALDGRGRVAAATSTGGTAWKRPGRVGDSALIGAGTFADDRTGAASSTGLGEAIVRAMLARVAVDQLRAGVAPERAARLALAEVTAVGGTAGLILVDRFGRIGAAHTTPHMAWCSRHES